MRRAQGGGKTGIEGVHTPGQSSKFATVAEAVIFALEHEVDTTSVVAIDRNSNEARNLGTVKDLISTSLTAGKTRDSEIVSEED